MGGSIGFFAYPPPRDDCLWISDGKARRDMTPEEVAEQRRKDREAKARQAQRMRSDPLYREERLAVRRKWADANRDRRNAAARASYAGRRDEARARHRTLQRERYARNSERRLTYMREWRMQNPFKAHLYVRVSDAKRRKAEIAGPGFTTADWLELVRTFEGKCAYCGECKPLEIEHKIPLSRGGTHELSNISPACRQCNARKAQMTDVEFRLVLAVEAAARAASLAKPPDPDGSAPEG